MDYTERKTFYFTHKHKLLGIAFAVLSIFSLAVKMVFATPLYDYTNTITDPSCIPSNVLCTVSNFPDDTGHPNEFLTTDGAGALSWSAAGTGTVTSVNASGGTTGLSFTGGPVTGSGTLTMSGTLAIANGGTGATSANGALNALLPSQSGQAGAVLTTDGINTSWSSATDLSSALSVTVASVQFLSGSPVYYNGPLNDGVGATLTRTGNGTLGTPETDGVVLTVGDRILVKNQASAIENGVYEVTDAGSVSTPYVLTRTTDSDLDTELDDQIVVPTQGFLQQNQVFGQTTQTPVIGTDSINYTTITSAYVSQSFTGTQLPNQIPLWTANGKQLSRGDMSLRGGTTWTTGALTVGKQTQGGRILFARGSDGSNTGGTFGWDSPTTSVGMTWMNNSGATPVINIRTGGSTSSTILLNAGLSGTVTTPLINLATNNVTRISVGSQSQSLNPYGTSAGNTYETRFLELAAGGSNYVGFKSPDAITTNTIWTLPSADGTSGQVLSTNGTGTLSWATVSGGGGTPAGSNTEIQFNNSGSFGASSDLTFDDGTDVLSVNGTINAATQYNINGAFFATENSSLTSIRIGETAGNGTSTGTNNIFIGYGSGSSNTTGFFNTFLGVGSGSLNTTGGLNVFIGNSSGGSNTTGDGNTFTGYSSGASNTTGQNNSLFGYQAGRNYQTISNQVAVGYQALMGSVTLASNTGTLNTAVGYQAATANTSGDRGTFLGYQAGAANTTGDDNIFLGYQAGLVNTTGNQNVFVGTNAGASNTTAVQNSFVGYNAGTATTTGFANAFFGLSAGEANTTGTVNTFVGSNAGKFTTTGIGNTFSGAATGQANTTGNYNVFTGYLAGTSNTTASNNAFLGYQAGTNNTTGSINVFIGSQAGLSNTTGFRNSFVGYEAGRGNTTGTHNTFMGNAAGYTNTTGTQNVFMGYNAGGLNTTGGRNVFLGYNAGQANTTAADNIFVGYQAGYSNTTGTFNTFIGTSAGYSNSTGDFNTFTGYQAGNGNTTGTHNVFSGYLTGSSNSTGSDNTFIGYRSGRANTTGQFNLFNGVDAGFENTTGTGNIMMGFRAGERYQTASNQIVIGYEALRGSATLGDNTGTLNTVIGYQSGNANTAGANNTFLGYQTGLLNTIGNDNVFLGKSAGDSNVDGSGNVLIGVDTDVSTSSTSNAIALGEGAVASANQFMIGSAGAPINTLVLTGAGNTCTLDVTVASPSCTSDERLKTNITDLDGTVLDTLMHVRTVNYSWKNYTDAPAQIGFLAQDLQQYFPQMVSTAPNGFLTVSYGGMTPVLVEAVRELNLKVEGISTTIETGGTFAEALRTFFENASNGIRTLFAKKVQTDELCVGSRCVTEAEFIQLLDSANVSNVSTGGTSDPSDEQNIAIDNTLPPENTDPAPVE